MIKIVVIVLTTVLVSSNAAPVNSTVSEYDYCNETDSTSSDMLHILYDDLDNALDVLGEVCLNYNEIVR